jgi:hypothetical protein
MNPGSQLTPENLRSSHAVTISHPNAVADIIRNAAEATSRRACSRTLRGGSFGRGLSDGTATACGCFAACSFCSAVRWGDAGERRGDP